MIYSSSSFSLFSSLFTITQINKLAKTTHQLEHVWLSFQIWSARRRHRAWRRSNGNVPGLFSCSRLCWSMSVFILSSMIPLFLLWLFSFSFCARSFVLLRRYWYSRSSPRQLQLVRCLVAWLTIHFFCHQYHSQSSVLVHTSPNIAFVYLRTHIYTYILF